MAYLARTITPADGATDLFPVSFPLAPIQGREGVGVYVHVAAATNPGTKLVEGVAYSWVSDGQISFLSGYRPAGGMVVDVRRETDIQAIDNIIQPGGSLRSEELVQNDQQLLYLLQEALDASTDLQNQLAMTDAGLLFSVGAAGGAGLVGFSHAQAYASGTIGKKLLPVISVTDDPWNATGGGVVDDLAAIQACFDANPNATINFPKAAATYLCSSSVILSDHTGRNFQGDISGDSASITFTNNGNAADADAAMQRGFAAYPSVLGVGGDASAMRNVSFSGLDITGPAHGASVYLSNCQDIELDIRTVGNRYGIAEECCTGVQHKGCVFEDYKNAGVGLIMSGDTARVWYGSVTPLTSYWNDSPLFLGCGFKNSLLTQPLAHILDHGSFAESVRSIGGCYLFSRSDDNATFNSTQYGILSRGGNWQTLGTNWFENVPYPIRILDAAAVEGAGALTGVAGAEPAGTYAISNFPDGFSYSGRFKGQWFSRALIALDVSGIHGTAEVGGNVDQLLRNTGTHIRSIATTTTQKILDSGSQIVSPVGAFTYVSVVNGVHIRTDAQFTTWAPAVVSTGGVITTLGVINCKYEQRGKTVTIHGDIIITTNGTGSGAITVPLPVAAANNGGTVSGREDVVSGKMLQGKMSGANLTLTFYDNTYPGANGARFLFSGTYEAA